MHSNASDGAAAALASLKALQETHLECYRCGRALVAKPVLDDGDKSWRPQSQWRTWCSDGCHDQDGEEDEMNRQEAFYG